MRHIATVLVLVLLSGCATITRGTSESFVIETEPPGASATLTNGMSCTTPCSLKVKRRGDFVVTLEREGYEPVTATVTSSVDGGGAAGMAGNVILGGLIGAGVDAGSGAMHSHKPNPLTVSLVKMGEAPALPDAVDDAVAPNDEEGVDIAESGEAPSANEAVAPEDGVANDTEVDDEEIAAAGASALVP